MFATGVNIGLAEWIIYDTCLVHFYSHFRICAAKESKIEDESGARIHSQF